LIDQIYRQAWRHNSVDGDSYDSNFYWQINDLLRMTTMKIPSIYFSVIMALGLGLISACGDSKNPNTETQSEDLAAQNGHNHDHDHDHDHDDDHGHHPEAGSEISELGLFRVNLEWKAMPVAGRAVNQAQLMIFDATGGVIDGVLKGFHPWMPAMGHGSNESAISWAPAAVASHSFDISGIFFNMGGAAGDWVIRLVVEIDGVEDQITVPVVYEVK